MRRMEDKIEVQNIIEEKIFIIKNNDRSTLSQFTIKLNFNNVYSIRHDKFKNAYITIGERTVVSTNGDDHNFYDNKYTIDEIKELIKKGMSITEIIISYK